VLVQNAKLAVDVPGQMVFELAEPDASGKWKFLIDPNIAVSFDRDASGAVTGMKMYQAGMTFELPKGEAAPEPKLSEAEVAKYLGFYRVPEENIEIEVVFRDGKLAILKPGVPMDLRRFVAVAGQLDLTWDLFSMSGPEILELLPSEFDRWKLGRAPSPAATRRSSLGSPAGAGRAYPSRINPAARQRPRRYSQNGRRRPRCGDSSSHRAWTSAGVVNLHTSVSRASRRILPSRRARSGRDAEPRRRRSSATVIGWSHRK